MATVKIELQEEEETVEEEQMEDEPAAKRILLDKSNLQLYLKDEFVPEKNVIQFLGEKQVNYKPEPTTEPHNRHVVEFLGEKQVNQENKSEAGQEPQPEPKPVATFRTRFYRILHDKRQERQKDQADRRRAEVEEISKEMKDVEKSFQLSMNRAQQLVFRCAAIIAPYK